MNHIVTYVRDYFREEWNPKLFASVGAFIILSFAINYGFDFERQIVSQLTHPLQQFAFYFLFYSIPYAFVIATYAATTRRKIFLREKQFYLLSFFCFVLLAVYVALHNLPWFLLKTSRLLFDSFPKEYHWYVARYAGNLLPGVFTFFPLATYWFLKDKEGSNLYGFSASNINLRTYFGILLILIPIVLIASLSSDFQSAYPRYKFGLPQNVGGGERNHLVGMFEMCYGVDFVFVELLFRGFMVMAFARYLGSGAILPMVVVYAFIHFQKPMGEAIGSVFGGLVLGIISYRTKSIYGGIILHLGVAYLMEIAGTIQVLFR